MHVFFGLLSAIAGVLFLLWRLNMAARAATDLVETAGDTRKWFRRRKWQKKATYDQFANIEDPREAAAAMLVAVAEYDGAMTERERATIIAGMKANFDVDEKVAGELLAQGRYLAQESSDLSYFLKRFAEPVSRVCGPKEQHQLLTMLTNTIEADGAPNDVTRHAIADLKYRFGI